MNGTITSSALQNAASVADLPETAGAMGGMHFESNNKYRIN